MHLSLFFLEKKKLRIYIHRSAAAEEFSWRQPAGMRASSRQPCSVQGACCDKVTSPPVPLRSAQSWMCKRQQARVHFALRSVWAHTKSCGLAPSCRSVQRCRKRFYSLFFFLQRSCCWQNQQLLQASQPVFNVLLLLLLCCCCIFGETRDSSCSVSLFHADFLKIIFFF